MSDLVVDPEDRFSRVMAHLFFFVSHILHLSSYRVLPIISDNWPRGYTILKCS